MEQRARFVPITGWPLHHAELSARYGISRKTGYKWLDDSIRAGVKDWAIAAGARGVRTKISNEVATLICEAVGGTRVGRTNSGLARARHPRSISRLRRGDLLARKGW